jgi:hypothetical protein
MDRAVGYGLKLPSSFHDTHLGRIGREKEARSGWSCLAARQDGAAQGGAEHPSERTRRCVSEERKRQRGDVPSW